MRTTGSPTTAPAAPTRRRRIAHLHETDPDGCFVAEDDAGEIVGLSLSFIREGVWGYSLLAVAEPTIR